MVYRLHRLYRDCSIKLQCLQDSSEEHSTQQRFDGGVTVIVHEKYGDAFYDVAIIRLPRPLTFNDYVQPICLPSSPVAVGTNCVATGWGETRGKQITTFGTLHTSVLRV